MPVPCHFHAMSHSSILSHIDNFVASLAQTTPPPQTFNQYDHHHEANSARRHNLRLYLQQMARRAPALMLVAEAPGYRGCRLTGVPFASPAIMRDGLQEVGLFGEARGYRTTAEWPQIQREASATILWQTLIACDVVPLLWNSFPFHPFQPGNRRSNRAPRAAEITQGEPFLRRLLALFPVTAVVAVGNKAEAALTRWNVPFRKVRHPSHGGKRQFRQGLCEIAKTLNA